MPSHVNACIGKKSTQNTSRGVNARPAKRNIFAVTRRRSQTPSQIQLAHNRAMETLPRYAKTRKIAHDKWLGSRLATFSNRVPDQDRVAARKLRVVLCQIIVTPLTHD